MNYKPFQNEETRSSVLAGVRSGSEAAWARFFDLYAGYVFSLARRAGIPDPDADDVVQTVFAGLAAPGGFDGYERGRGAFRPWLRRRAEWRIADRLRRLQAENALFVQAGAAVAANAPAPDPGADESWMEAVREEALRRLKETSAPDHFAIFQASVLEELPTEDVMRLYRVSRDNLYQVRKRMKAAFAAHVKAAAEDMDAPLPPL